MFELTIDTSSSSHAAAKPASASFDWHQTSQEGQLAVDVLASEKELLVVSTLAGAEANKIEVFIHNDLLTIRGERRFPIAGSLKSFHKECYWGKFSRSVVLPIDVKGELAQADYQNGVLIIRIPVHSVDRRVPITIVEE
ncbi:MAG: Hsp20/alpha crystallin family protein [Candidatus Magasanikbacteria bacterium]|jgi:HSP20 family protein|nr:Hsp20/alpha crystallin family protein [Candidatus Magasanikbacteria bacterium]